MYDLKNRALAQHAKDKGTVQDEIDKFEDGDVTKEAFISSMLEILWKRGEVCRAEEAAT